MELTEIADIRYSRDTVCAEDPVVRRIHFQAGVT